MTDSKFLNGSPVCCSDMAGHQFLLGPDSAPVSRYSHCSPTVDMEALVDALLSQEPSCVQDPPPTLSAWYSQSYPVRISSLRMFPLKLHTDNI